MSVHGRQPTEINPEGDNVRLRITPRNQNRTVTMRGGDGPLRESAVEAFLVRRAGEDAASLSMHGVPAGNGEEHPPALLVPSPGLVIAGKYRLEAPLAQGGMGSVWIARHLDLDILVAVKLMAPEYRASSHQRARFMREARAAARLRSRNVVTVLDYGVDRCAPYIVMELLEGEDLLSRLERQRCMSGHETAKILDSIARALDLAHVAGIVHRDLKPANIFLARVAGETDEVVKVLDFGIAKELNPSPDYEGTKSGVVIGTPHYMSPEQADGIRTLDHRSDLWSLGVILFQALTGRLPFEGTASIEILDAIARAPIPLPSSVAPHLSGEVDRFFERALARDRNSRFQTVWEMVEAFHCMLPGMLSPQQAPPRVASELSSGDFIAIDASQLDTWACGRPALRDGAAPVVSNVEPARSGSGGSTNEDAAGFHEAGARFRPMHWIAVRWSSLRRR